MNDRIKGRSVFAAYMAGSCSARASIGIQEARMARRDGVPASVLHWVRCAREWNRQAVYWLKQIRVVA